MAELALKHLKENDIRMLVRHPEEGRRAIAAQRICRTFRDRQLSEGERNFALKLLGVMADDTADVVRRALAVTLKNSPDLPKDIAARLIADIDNIAAPVLLSSPVLAENDLIDVLRSKAAGKIIAIAKRSHITGNIVRAVIRYGDSLAVAELAANDTALIDEAAAAEMLDIYRDDDLIKDAMIAREDLPIRVAEKLITLVSEEAAVRIVERHPVSPEAAIDLATRARERATVDFVQHSWISPDIRSLVTHLHGAGRLTASLVIRAVGSGQMRFAEHALAQLSGVSAAKAALMIHDSGPFALKALCVRAGLGEPAVKMVRAACSIYRDLELSGVDYDHSRFQELMIERLLTLPFSMPQTDQAYFLEKLDAVSAQAA